MGLRPSAARRVFPGVIVVIIIICLGEDCSVWFGSPGARWCGWRPGSLGHSVVKGLLIACPLADTIEPLIFLFSVQRPAIS